MSLRPLLVFSTPFPPREGIGNYVANLATQLKTLGHEPALATRGTGLRATTESWNGIEVVRLPFVPAYPFHVHVQARLAQRWLTENEGRFDLVHFHSPLPPPLKTRLPTLTTFHTPVVPQYERVTVERWQDRLAKAQARVSAGIERRLIRQSTLVTAVSESIREEMKRAGMHEGSIEITPNGVDVGAFAPGDKKVPGRVLYTGRLGPRKGLPDLLRAARLMVDQSAQFELVITGAGSYRSLLDDMARNLRLEDRIRFVGFVSRDEITELYRTAEVFAFPTHYEGLPTSLLEAMACGLPIVTTDAPGARDLVRDRMEGRVAQVGDVHAIANHIRELLADPDLRARLGKAARARAEAHDWKVLGRSIEETYRRVIGNAS